jgi:DNA repair protein RecN (Recombination protein N)
MLAELVVENLGVIERLAIRFDVGMTAVTGETGAGKTLVVGAIELLLGGRAEPHMVRSGSDEARIDGRFLLGNEEIVLTRVIPRTGRSRAYVDHRPSPVSVLAEMGAKLVDLHGQHAHQSLLHPAAQRAALDAFAGIEVKPLIDARAEVRSLELERTAFGGDERARARELDLVRFQLAELEAANLVDPGEEKVLQAEEDLLSDAQAHQEAASTGQDALSGEGGARDSVGETIRVLSTRAPYEAVVRRLRDVAGELEDINGELRSIGESIEDNPSRLADVRSRRQLLKELQRKYGDDLASVLAFRDETQLRVTELLEHDKRAAAVDAKLGGAIKNVQVQALALTQKRRASCEKLASAIEGRLRQLAMPKARINIHVGDVPIDGEGEVVFLLAANAGTEPLPMAKVASGGELARVMLSLRLALLEGRQLVDGDPPETLIFDEVDAGIGGQAAVAVGNALADLGVGRQVVVVTHLAQVAACATHQVQVLKVDSLLVDSLLVDSLLVDSSTVLPVSKPRQASKKSAVVAMRTVTSAVMLEREQRITELARMLAGNPDSKTARDHAEELLDSRSTAATTNFSKVSKTSKTQKTPLNVTTSPTAVTAATAVETSSGSKSSVKSKRPR